MLMHTKVFGRYNGPEEIMLETPNYTEINVIGNYAPTAKAVVTVTDANGNLFPEPKLILRCTIMPSLYGSYQIHWY